MKILLLPMGLLAVASGFAQGILEFSNRGTERDDRPVFTTNGVVGLAGPRYSAQLFAGTNGTPDGQLAAVGAPRPFVADGFWASANRAIPGVPSGQLARLQVKVWDNQGGAHPTFDSATLKASSPSFSVRLDSQRPWDKLFGMGSFALPPGRPLPHPAETVFRRFAMDYGVRSSMCDPGPPQDLKLSGDGNWAAYRVYSPCPKPHVTAELQSIREGVSERLPANNEPLDFPGFPAARWALVALSADASRMLGNVVGADGVGSRAFLGRPTNAVPLPLRRGLALSGNGRHVFGESLDGQWVRWDLREGTALPLAVPATLTNLSVRGCSHDGDSWLVESGNPAIQAWWRRQGGWQILDRRRVYAVALSAEGDALAGIAPGTGDPVVVSAALQLEPVPLAKALGVPVRLSDGGRLLWCRQGLLDRANNRTFTVPELLHGSALDNFRIPGPNRSAPTSLSVFAASDDGRTVALSGRSPSAQVGDSSITYWFFARVALPDDGVQVALAPAEPGKLRLRFPSQRGIRYRVESGTDLRDWSEIVSGHEGTDATAQFDLEAGDPVRRFFRVRAEVMAP